jgi:hypothetical protein
MSDLSIVSSSVVKGAGATTSTAIAAQAINAGQTIWLNASNQAQLFNATLTGATMQGLSLDNAAIGQPLVYCTQGLCTVATGGLTTGVPLFASPTAGNLSNSQTDITAGNYTTFAGYCASSSQIYLTIISSNVAHA